VRRKGGRKDDTIESRLVGLLPGVHGTLDLDDR
jgi:hypothetical protein